MQASFKTPPLNQQVRIFTLLWAAYASYYLCRLNFAVAQPALLKHFPAWTSAQIGLIPSVYAGCYAAGQIINGTLGQKLGTRLMMTAALLTISLINLIFSYVSSYTWMVVLWGINGYAQSAGWSLMVVTLARWTSPPKRSTAIGLLSTCYQVGNVLAWLLAGTLCDRIDWRAAFWVPSFILLPVAVLFGIFMRNSPESEGIKKSPEAVPGEANPSDNYGLSRILFMTLANRILWLLGVSYLCMNAVRFTFLNWTVQYLTDFHKINIKGSAWIAAIIPMVGSAGAISAGWASDRFFNRHSAPVCTLMLLGLAFTCLLFNLVPKGDWGLAALCLGLAGFMIYGPDMLLAGTAAMEFSHPKATITATGLIMCLGNLGGIFAGAGIGYLRDLAQGRWELVFSTLAGLSVISALFTASLWMRKKYGQSLNRADRV